MPGYGISRLPLRNSAFFRSLINFILLWYDNIPVRQPNILSLLISTQHFRATSHSILETTESIIFVRIIFNCVLFIREIIQYNLKIFALIKFTRLNGSTNVAMYQFYNCNTTYFISFKFKSSSYAFVTGSTLFI